MDKERLMQFLSDAIDMGFDINVRCIENISKEQAEGLAERFASIVGGKVELAEGANNIWFDVQANKGQYQGSFFHAESMKKEALTNESI